MANNTPRGLFEFDYMQCRARDVFTGFDLHHVFNMPLGRDVRQHSGGVFGRPLDRLMLFRNEIKKVFCRHTVRFYHVWGGV